MVEHRQINVKAAAQDETQREICPVHLVRQTLSRHRGSVSQARSGWDESAPPCLTPWFPAREEWIAPSVTRDSNLLKNHSEHISGFCLRVKAKWSVR